MSSERSVLHVLPHPGGGGETYVDALAVMDGYRFERAYLASSSSPVGARASILRNALRVQRSARSFDLVHVVGEVASALCLVLPSRREGYGLDVLEAVSRGTPAVVVRGDDNAAAELVVDGENGFVASSASAADLAAAIVRVHEAGTALREATLAWFRRNEERLSLEHSLGIVLATYAALET